MNIKITPEYLEKINNSGSLRSIMNKSLGNRLSYQLARVLNKIEQESRIYFAEKQKIISKFAKHYDSDGEERDKNGKVIRKWKKGDIISIDGKVTIEDVPGFTEAMNELLQTEIDLGIEKIKLDFSKLEDNNKIDLLSVQEMQTLIPLLEE